MAQYNETLSVLLLQRIEVCFPTPMWWFTTVYHSVPEDLTPLMTFSGTTHTYDMHKYMQVKQSYA